MRGTEVGTIVLPGCQQQSERDEIAEAGDLARQPDVRSPTVLTESVNTAAIRMAQSRRPA